MPITNQDIYNAINDLRQEVNHNLERLEDDVKENTNFRNQLIGKITVMMALIGIGVNWLWDLFVNRKG